MRVYELVERAAAYGVIRPVGEAVEFASGGVAVGLAGVSVLTYSTLDAAMSAHEDVRFVGRESLDDFLGVP